MVSNEKLLQEIEALRRQVAQLERLLIVALPGQIDNPNNQERWHEANRPASYPKTWLGWT